MADPYYRYGAFPDRGLTNFSGYLSSETPSLPAYHIPGTNGLVDAASNFPNREITPSQPGTYGLDNIAGIGVRSEPAVDGVLAGSSGRGYPSPLQDPSIPRQRQDGSVNVNSTIADMINDKPNPLTNVDGSSLSRKESKVLIVEGFPTDCTRREVGHLFCPFIGYKDIKVIHKEPRHSGDKAMVFCFVEFVDANCAITAMEALQGYKFDDKKPNSRILRIDFAHFPLHFPSDHSEEPIGIPL